MKSKTIDTLQNVFSLRCPQDNSSAGKQISPLRWLRSLGVYPLFAVCRLRSMSEYVVALSGLFPRHTHGVDSEELS